MDEADRRIEKNSLKARLDVRAFNAGALEFYSRRGWTECRRYEVVECGAPVETIEIVKNLKLSTCVAHKRCFHIKERSGPCPDLPKFQIIAVRGDGLVLLIG